MIAAPEKAKMLRMFSGSATVNAQPGATRSRVRDRSTRCTSPAVVAGLLSKEVDYSVELVQAVIGQVQAGEIKVLAVASPQRWPALPNVRLLQVHQAHKDSQGP